MKVRPILERLVLVVFGVGVALALGEVAARLAVPDAPIPAPRGDPAPSTEGWSVADFTRANIRGRMASGALYRTNRHGFRGREYAARKPARVFRIMIFGDSVTMGSGVEEDEAYPARLEQALNERRSGSATIYEVLNLGVPGAHIEFAAQRMTTDVSRFDPDLVVYGWTVNDIEGPAYETTALPLAEVRRRQEAFRQSLFARSALYRTVVTHWTGLREVVRPPSDSYVFEIKRNYFHNPTAWADFSGELDRLARIQEERGVCVLVFLHTQLYSLNFLYPLRAIHRRVEEASLDRGLHVTDSFDAHRGHSAPSLWVSPSDPHPNPAGHGILAEALGAGLEQAPLRCRPGAT